MLRNTINNRLKNEKVDGRKTSLKRVNNLKIQGNFGKMFLAGLAGPPPALQLNCSLKVPL
jgi:hypothetical protein